MSLEPQVTKWKLSHFGYIMRRQSSLEKTLMLGEKRSSRKQESSNVRWSDSIKEPDAWVCRCWAGLVRTGHCGRQSFTGLPGVGANSIAYNTHKLLCPISSYTKILFIIFPTHGPPCFGGKVSAKVHWLSNASSKAHSKYEHCQLVLSANKQKITIKSTLN